MLNKLRDYKSELARLSAVTAGVPRGERGEQPLAAPRGRRLDDVSAPTSSSQRDRMAQGDQQLDRTGNRIRDGKRTLLETEDLGVSILRTCRQRETIVSARAHTRRGR